MLGCVGSRECPSGFARARIRILALSAATLGVALAVPANLVAAQPTQPTDAAPEPAADAQQPSPNPSPADPSPPADPADNPQQPDPGSAPAGARPTGADGGSPSHGLPAERAVLASSRVAAKASSVAIVGAQFSAFAFNPKTITVHVGDTVRWVNKSSAPEGHTVTGHGLDSGTLHQGDDYSFKFSKAGTYSYVCAFHSNMKGKVKVLASGSGGGGGSSGGGSGGGGGSSGSGTGSGGTSTSGFGSSAADPGSSGQLPVTGLPLLPLGIAGVALVALGLVLRRRAELY
jgi:plastocyanin